MALPLTGIKVIELATWAALPGGGAILADWGAGVIKIEDPTTPDPLRGFSHIAGGADHPGVAPSFEQKNRNKRDITLDVSKPRGQEVLRGMLEKADVFITSMRPKTLARNGIDYESLRQINPRLVMVHLSGFGHKGPDADRPGYDALCFWARSGLALSLAEPDAPPIGQRPALGDVTTSIAVAGGVSAALFDRERTGRGKLVLASLYGTGLWIAAGDLVTSFASGQDVQRRSRKEVTNPLVNGYQTASGWLQLVNLQSDRFWEPLCRAVGRSDLIDDERFNTAMKRAENGRALVAIFEEEFAKRTTEEWIPRLDAEGIRWGKVQTTLETTRDEQAWSNGYFQKLEHPDVGEITLVSSPLQFDGEPSPIESSAPQIGQHTEEVLLEMGFSWDDLEELKSQRVIL